MEPPFLPLEDPNAPRDFVRMYSGTLTSAKRAQAELLLQVASDRIRGLKADVDTTAAQQVVFEVVRDAVTYGDLSKLSSFQNITSRRQEAGTFDEADQLVDDYLTDAHKRLLGIPLRAAPRGRFKKCDY